MKPENIGIINRFCRDFANEDLKNALMEMLERDEPSEEAIFIVEKFEKTLIRNCSLDVAIRELLKEKGGLVE